MTDPKDTATYYKVLIEDAEQVRTHPTKFNDLVAARSELLRCKKAEEKAYILRVHEELVEAHPGF